MDIYKKFNKITGLTLGLREVNKISHQIERKDSLFADLSRLFFSDKHKLKILQAKLSGWLKSDSDSVVWALAGYTYYICKQYKESRDCFLKLISIEPDNLDSWVDLAFALRHLGEYAVSNSILFNLKYVIYYYKYLKLKSGDYTAVKNLALEIDSNA